MKTRRRPPMVSVNQQRENDVCSRQTLNSGESLLRATHFLLEKMTRRQFPSLKNAPNPIHMGRLLHDDMGSLPSISHTYKRPPGGHRSYSAGHARLNSNAMSILYNLTWEIQPKLPKMKWFAINLCWTFLKTF